MSGSKSMIVQQPVAAQQAESTPVTKRKAMMGGSKSAKVLTPEDIALYDARVRRELSPNLARWLEGGSLATGDARSTPD